MPARGRFALPSPLRGFSPSGENNLCHNGYSFMPQRGQIGYFLVPLTAIGVSGTLSAASDAVHLDTNAIICHTPSTAKACAGSGTVVRSGGVRP